MTTQSLALATIQLRHAITVVPGSVPLIHLGGGNNHDAKNGRLLQVMLAMNCLRMGASSVQLAMLYSIGDAETWGGLKTEIPRFVKPFEVKEDAPETFQCDFDDVNWILTMKRHTPPPTAEEILTREG